MCIDLKQATQLLANIAAIAGAFVSVIIFRHNVNRDRKILTIKTFTEIRERHHKETYEMSEDELKEYLKDMEYFCIGINKNIYDIDILQRMSGKRLLGQYNKTIRPFINTRRERQGQEDSWNEYEKTMKRLQKNYKKG